MVGPHSPFALASLLAAAIAAPQAPAPANDSSNESSRHPTLTVSGEAVVEAAPDRARIELGATAQAAEAATAQQQVNAVVTRAIAALREAGVADDAIQTTGVTLHPVYSDGRRPASGENDAPRIVAYRASNAVQVRVDDPTSIGTLIDAGVGAGANQLSGLSFELSDDTEQRVEALATAVRNARRKAEALAAAAGVRLVGVEHVAESGADVVTPMQHFSRAATFDAGAPVEPGRVRVRGSVTLTYRIASLAPNEGG